MHELKDRIKEVAQEYLQKHNLAVENLTREQTLEAFRQAVMSGDFVRYVRESVPGEHYQSVVYIPGKRADELANERDVWRSMAKRLFGLLESARAGVPADPPGETGFTDAVDDALEEFRVLTTRY